MSYAYDNSTTSPNTDAVSYWNDVEEPTTTPDTDILTITSTSTSGEYDRVRLSREEIDYLYNGGNPDGASVSTRIMDNDRPPSFDSRYCYGSWMSQSDIFTPQKKITDWQKEIENETQ